jgi:hypothetical protein
MTLRDEQETRLEARHSKMALVKLKAVPPELLPQLIRTVLDTLTVYYVRMSSRVNACCPSLETLDTMGPHAL